MTANYSIPCNPLACWWFHPDFHLVLRRFRKFQGSWVASGSPRQPVKPDMANYVEADRGRTNMTRWDQAVRTSRNEIDHPGAQTARAQSGAARARRIAEVLRQAVCENFER